MTNNDKIRLRDNGDGTYTDQNGHHYRIKSDGKMTRLRQEQVENVSVPRTTHKKLPSPVDVKFGKDAMNLEKGRFVIPIPKKFAEYIKARVSTSGRAGRQVFIRFANGHGASIVNTVHSRGVEIKPVTWNHHLNKHDELKSFSYYSDKWDGYEQIRIRVDGNVIGFGRVVGNATKQEIVQTLEAIEALPVLLDGDDYEGHGKPGTFKIERYLLSP